MYQRINDYGLIGNVGTSALVGLNGAIDWCCLPHLESPAVFCAILDHVKGGRFRVAPEGDFESSQRYEPERNILQTEFRTGGGVVRVTDFMPFANRPGDSHRPVIYRRVEGLSGRTHMRMTFAPRFDYARAETHVACHDGYLRATDGRETLYVSVPVEPRLEGNVASARFPVDAGQQAWIVLSHGAAADGGAVAESALASTRRGWDDWVHRCDERRCVFGGPWHDHVVRSALVLKLLTHGETGSLAAAATASLPEDIGGQRNWDYRFCWVRDSSFTVQALHNLGHALEGEAFLRWACRVMSRNRDPSHIQIMYGLHGETDLAEQELDHLEGYRRSHPVRIGNGAASQRQLDIYGELMDAAWQLGRHGHRLDPASKSFLGSIADYVCQAWRERDAGIWEVRGAEQHFVYSKVMCWVALDRALRLHRRYRLPGNVARWRAEAGRIRSAVLSDGYDERLGAFVQAFGSKALDASGLLFPLMGFLPFADPRVQSTVNAIIRELSHDALVYRYRVEDTNDGLAGEEGAFLLCSFWLVDCLALSGRVGEARERFRALQGYANHLGLYAEEVDPGTGELLGNFPQAFTHIGFINSALYLGRAHGRVQMGPAPLGTRDTTRIKLKRLLLRIMKRPGTGERFTGPPVRTHRRIVTRNASLRNEWPSPMPSPGDFHQIGTIRTGSPVVLTGKGMSMASRTNDVLLMIADISGYTRFMVANQTELAHSHQIIGTLLESIIAQVEIPLQVAKLEGDAVFLYLIMADHREAARSHARERLMRFFGAFRSTLGELATTRTCTCGACSNVDALRLKVVVHSGTALIYSIATHTELAGVDVIILHRLLKNSIPFDEYILLTEAATRDLPLDLPVLVTATEAYGEIGTIDVTAYRPVVEPQAPRTA